MTLPDSVAPTYADLAQRLAANDASALRELFDALHEPLLRFCARFVDSAAAQDAVQEAFVRIWDRRHTLDASLSLRALLFRTVRNLAFNSVRDINTRARLLAQEPPEQLAGSQPVTPEHFVDQQELGTLLRNSIGALPERQREALTLSRFEGLSHQEIADVMNVSVRTVNNHLVRALETLRQRLHQAGVLYDV